MDNNLYNLILRSLDAPLAEREQRELESALADSEEFRYCTRRDRRIAQWSSGPERGNVQTIFRRTGNGSLE